MLDVRRFYPFLYLHFEPLLHLYKEWLQFSLISEFTSKVEKNKKCDFLF